MKLLIATHGKLAEGLKSSLSIIAGNVDNVTAINAYVDDIDFKLELDKYFKENENEKLVVLTDIFGGSVNQAIALKLKEKDFILVSGVNFPLALEVTMAINNDDVTIEQIREIIENAKGGIMCVNDILSATNSSDDDFD